MWLSVSQHPKVLDGQYTLKRILCSCDKAKYSTARPQWSFFSLWGSLNLYWILVRLSCTTLGFAFTNHFWLCCELLPHLFSPLPVPIQLGRARYAWLNGFTQLAGAPRSFRDTTGMFATNIQTRLCTHEIPRISLSPAVKTEILQEHLGRLELWWFAPCADMLLTEARRSYVWRSKSLYK